MIQIYNSDLNSIEIEYSKELKKKILLKIDNIHEVISILRSKNIADDKTVKNKVNYLTSALIAVTGIKNLLSSKSTKEEKKTQYLINSLNKLKISSDKRSKCRKTIKYNNVELQIKKIKKFINKKNLFGSEPQYLMELNYTLNRYLGTIDKNLYFYFFDYTKYYEIINNKIGKQLNLNCCPYCNRNYITYIPNGIKRHIGPTYDHFFSKEIYKYLTISFYNLIPSCYICNSNLKGRNNFKLNTNIHPFIEGFDDDCTFDFELSTKDYLGKKEISYIPKLEIKDFVSSSKKIKIKGNLKVFKLNQIYESHEDSIEEIYTRFDKGSPYYIGSISEILNKLNVTEEEFYRFHFRNYFNEIEFNKRPLAKLDKNIYEKFKSISDIN